MVIGDLHPMLPSPSSVLGQGSPPDPGASAYLRYANGARAFLNGSSYNAIGWRLELIGTEGYLVLTDGEPELWKSTRAAPMENCSDIRTAQVGYPKSAMVGMLEDLISAIEHNRNLLPRADGKAALEVILAIHESSGHGNARISLPYQNRVCAAHIVTD